MDMEILENQDTTSYFSALPEELISLILSKTSSRDACRMSAVSSQFRSAAESDLVWECFLPPHYLEIIPRCVDPLIFASKKELYSRLSRSLIFIDNNTKVFSLLNASGKICCGLRSKTLSVTAQHPRPNSWFILGLKRRWDLVVNFGHGFEIKGRLDTRLLSPDSTYQSYVSYKTTEVDGHNFNEFSSSCPLILVSMKFFKDGKIVKTSDFQTNLVINSMRSSSTEEEDEWTKLEIGEFFNNAHDFDDVEISLKETERLDFYNGPAIIFFGIGFRPILS